MMLQKVTDTAKELIRFKSQAETILFAKETADYFNIQASEDVLESFGFWASVVHFEMRYRSLNYFLEKADSDSVLELSSGFSFRSFEYCLQHSDKVYVDTDLKLIIEEKKKILKHFNKAIPENLHFHELDVLDISSYPAIKGNVDVFNEGLLLYFNREGQKQILKNISTLLKKNNGTWTTADIYLQHETDAVGSDQDKKWNKFFEKAEVKKNMFSSFDEAEQFFYDNGFVVTEKYNPEFEKLSSLPKLFQYGTQEQLEKLKNKGRVQETWQLTLK